MIKKINNFGFIKPSFFKEESLLTPDKLFNKSKNKLDVLIVTFCHDLIEILLKDKKLVNINDCIKSVSSPFPVYQIKGTKIGLFLTHPGAPYCAMAIEEISCLFGPKKIISFGSCGYIGKDMKYEILVPTKAYKFDGVSNYYDYSSKEYIDIDNSSKVSKVFSKNNIDHTTTIVATTDCLYRETKSFIKYCQSKKVTSLDMEVSGIQALCKFRKLKYFPFFFRADFINEKEYSPNDLVTIKSKNVEKYFSYALILAKEL